MPNLTSADLAKCCKPARVKENHELLSRLDAATGDGDHGVTMKRVAEAIIEYGRERPIAGPVPCWSRSAGA